MSMFGKDATFTSAAIVAEDLAARNSVDTESIKHLVHIVFGVSKVCIDGTSMVPIKVSQSQAATH